LQIVAWIAVVFMGLCIIASRKVRLPSCDTHWTGLLLVCTCSLASLKPTSQLVPILQHYSVDVVVAFYTVPLVFYTMHRRWTTKRPVQDYWCACGSLLPTSPGHPKLSQLPLLGLLLLLHSPARHALLPTVWCRPHRPLVGEDEVELADVGDIETGEDTMAKLDVSAALTGARSCLDGCDSRPPAHR
jgi:hypothetical protein